MNYCKSYVADHLMPVYVNLGLLADHSVDLRNLMQGKSCFNFRKLDPQLFAELERLSVRVFARGEENGLLRTPPGG